MPAGASWIPAPPSFRAPQTETGGAPPGPATESTTHMRSHRTHAPQSGSQNEPDGQSTCPRHSVTQRESMLRQYCPRAQSVVSEHSDFVQPLPIATHRMSAVGAARLRPMVMAQRARRHRAACCAYRRAANVSTTRTACRRPDPEALRFRGATGASNTSPGWRAGSSCTVGLMRRRFAVVESMIFA
jgi:hypothetical protein